MVNSDVSFEFDSHLRYILRVLKIDLEFAADTTIACEIRSLFRLQNYTHREDLPLEGADHSTFEGRGGDTRPRM